MAHDPSLPENVGPYEVTGLLAWGAFARVMRGWDPELAGPVAIKQLDARYASNDYIRERFVEEARWLYNADDPRIVRVIKASGNNEPLPWFAMRFVPGGNLTEHLAGYGAPLTPQQATALGVALCSCIGAVHELAGVIHRDVKPDNILLQPRSAKLTSDPALGQFAGHQLVVVDFGLAKRLADVSRLTSIAGTDQYMSPQQADGVLAADWRDDLYSVGVIVYEALTGRYPFDSPAAVKPEARRGLAPVPVQSVRPEVGVELAAAIESLLAPERDGRPADAAAAQARFIAADAAARRSLPPPAPVARPAPFPPPLPVAAAKIGRRGVVAGLVGAAAFGGWRLLRPTPTPQAASPTSGSATTPGSATMSGSATTQPPTTKPPTDNVAGAGPQVSPAAPPSTVSLPADRECQPAIIYTSIEKAAVLADLLTVWNQRPSLADPAASCVQFEVQSRASGTVACWLAPPAAGMNSCDTEALAAIDAEVADGRSMAVWMPASSMFGQLVEAGAPGRVSVVSGSTMSSPIVMAVAAPVLAGLGAADVPLGSVGDLIAGLDSEAFARRLQRPLRLGRTDPFVSATGLGSTVMIDQAARAAGRDGDLGADAAQRLRRLVESAVVHYGPSGPRFLTAALRHGGGATGEDNVDNASVDTAYVDVVLVEEKTVLDYNDGDPNSTRFRDESGVLTNRMFGQSSAAGDGFRRPDVRFTAVIPSDGTVLSDHPMYVVADASDEVRAAAAEFAEFLRTDAWARAKLANYHLRAPADLADSKVPPVASVIPVPSGEELEMVRSQWRADRKGFRVLFAVDVSTSMTECGEPRLQTASEALAGAISTLAPQDRVAVVPFSSSAVGQLRFVAEAPSMLVDDSFQPPDPTRGLPRQPDDGFPNTPLYEVAVQAVREMVALDDPTVISAVVLLTDGVNDPRGELGRLSCDLAAAPGPDDVERLAAMTPDLAVAVESLAALVAEVPLRLFTVAFGSGSAPEYLAGMAEATDGTTWDATSPDTLQQVLRAIVREF